jgi:ribonuclease HI
MASSSIKKFYAVAVGRQTGVFNDWVTCSSHVSGYPKAKYKMFVNESEAHAFAGTAKSIPLSEPKKPSSRKKRASSTPLDELEATTSTTTRRSSKRTEMNEQEIRARAEEEDRPPLDPNTQVIYTDGSCSGEGTPHAKAGSGVYFGKNDPRNISELVPGQHHTAQRGELYAGVRALQIFTDTTRPVEIRSDSKYLVRTVNEWMEGWFKTGVIDPRIKNPDLITTLRELCMARRKANAVTIFKHVHAHCGIEGNEAADRLAFAARSTTSSSLSALFQKASKK